MQTKNLKKYLVRSAILKRTFLTCLLAGTSCITFALDPNQFNLTRLTEELRANNAQLKQSQNNWEAAKEVGIQQSAPDNPTIGLSNNPFMKGGGLPTDANYTNQAYFFSLTQNIYFPGKKNLMGEIADKQADFVKTQISSTDLQLVNQLETNYFQALALEKVMEENKNQIVRLEQIKLATKVRYGNNAADFSDFISSQVAQSAAEKDQIAYKRQLAVLKGNINTLIGRKPSAPLDLVYDKLNPDALKTTLKELQDLGMGRNPNVEGAAHQKIAAEKSVNLAKLNYAPDFQITAFGNKQNQLWQGPGVINYGAQLNIIIPWVIFDKERASVSQAKANLRSSEENENNTRQQVSLAIESAHLMLKQSIDESNFIRNRLLPEAHAAYRIALQSYMHSQLAFSDLINAQNNLKNTEIQLVSADVNIFIARSNLEASVGEKIQ